MEYGLVENAMHSLSEAASYYNSADVEARPDRYKFGILLTAHCAELLLKEILLRVHPAFIYSDVDRYRQDSTNDETIGYKMAIKRVKTIAHVNLSVYENHLSELGEVRNRLQHFKYEINGEYHKQLMPNSEQFYYSAISDVNADEFKLLCPHCARDAQQSEDYIGFEISRVPIQE